MRVLELEDVILLLRSEVIRFLRSTRKSLYALISISVGSVGISDIAAFRDRARKQTPCRLQRLFVSYLRLWVELLTRSYGKQWQILNYFRPDIRYGRRLVPHFF
jgi:hypothetical protein